MPRKLLKVHLLASSGSIKGIQELINRYWYSEKYTINPETLAIEHPTRVPEGYRVTYVRGRYRFEFHEI